MASLQSFLLMWTPMTAVMMAPSALPFFVSLARRSRPWPLTTAAAILAYLLVWTVFGAGVDYASMAISLPMPALLAACVAIMFAGLYSVTPWMRAGQARCIAMCRRRHAVGFDGAAAEGLGYGVNCVLCSAGVMLALVVVGMTNIAWIAVGAVIIVIYKFAGVRGLVAGRLSSDS